MKNSNSFPVSAPLNMIIIYKTKETHNKSLSN